VRTLQARWGRDSRLTILPVGLADKPDVLTLLEATDHVVTTMSDDYASRTKYGNTFVRGREVRVVTLEHLVQMFGVPDFVKIDVEGFERQVLAGMETAVPMLSFKANPQIRTRRCSVSTCWSAVGTPFHSLAVRRCGWQRVGARLTRSGDC
jgi:hypothetical protein